MTTHSSILAWRIPWTEGPGGLQSIGLKSQARLKQVITITTTTSLMSAKLFPISNNSAK